MTVQALVVGAGSIGARHARNLANLGATVSVMDPDAERAAAIPRCNAIAFDMKATADADVVVIASPTAHHAHHVRRTLSQSEAKILVEKPLTILDDDFEDLARLAQGRLMVGFNLRLFEPVSRAVRLIHAGAVGEMVAARLWFGSWLPDWRPGSDYRATYSARSDLGGGVLLDAIHELDLAVWMMAEPLTAVHAFVGRLGPLEIDVEDTVKALLISESGVPVELSLDYLSRRYRRGMEVIGTEGTLRIDWSRQSLQIEDDRRVSEEVVTWDIDTSYVREAERLLAFAGENTEPPVDALTAAKSMTLAAAIKQLSHAATST